MIGDEFATPVRPPGEAVAVYFVIAKPPFDAGASNSTVACEDVKLTDTFCGAVGEPSGVPGEDSVDGVEAPCALTATMVNVYATPLVRP